MGANTSFDTSVHMQAHAGRGTWMQKAMTGSRVFFRLEHALVRKCWAATSGEMRSSKMSVRV